MTSDFLEIRQQRLDLLCQSLASCTGPRPSFVFEVGCGHGHFLTAYATAFPDRICIGVDHHGERIERATRKQQRGGLPRLHFFRAEARLFLEALPVGASIADVYILFPDPWPKLRHHKHRILQPGFLSALRPHMEAGARLMFRTDHREYFDEVRAILSAHAGWRIVEETWPFEFETIFQQRAASHHSLIARPAGAADETH